MCHMKGLVASGGIV